MRQFDRSHRADDTTPACATIQPERSSPHNVDHPVIETGGPLQVLRLWTWRLARHRAGGRNAAIVARAIKAVITGRLRSSRRAGRRRGTQRAWPGGHSCGLAEWRTRKVNHRGFRGMRQRWHNGRMTRPRTPCAPGRFRAGISRGTPYRTRRCKANLKTAGGHIPRPPSIGQSRPTCHTFCSHTHRTGNPSTSFILLRHTLHTTVRAGR